MASIIFDPTVFKLLFPEFINVDNARLDFFFQQACLVVSNKDNSIVQDLDARQTVLYLLTAHIGKLMGALANDGQPIPVGRVSTATEGSVTGEFDYPAFNSYEWFIQTQYGTAAWQYVRVFRQFYYVPGCIFSQNRYLI